MIDLAYEVEQVQVPWVVRVAHDERSFLYFNINTQDVVYDRPIDSQSQSRVPLINPADLELLCQQLGAPGKFTVPFLAYARQASTPHATKGPQAVVPTCPFGRRVPEACYTPPPPSLVHAQESTRALQQRLACGTSGERADLVDLEDRFTILTDLQEGMAQSMNRLVMAVSDVGGIQLTWSAKGHPVPPPNEVGRMMNASLTLEQRVSEVVQAMVRVVYASGGVQYVPEHLQSTTLKESTGSVSARSSCLPSRQQSITSPFSNSTIPIPSQQASTLSTTPPTILSASKCLSSYLSKLVLSAHMLLELYRAEA